jgi:hypothetical protein
VSDVLSVSIPNRAVRYSKLRFIIRVDSLNNTAFDLCCNTEAERFQWVNQLNKVISDQLAKKQETIKQWKSRKELIKLNRLKSKIAADKAENNANILNKASNTNNNGLTVATNNSSIAPNKPSGILSSKAAANNKPKKNVHYSDEKNPNNHSSNSARNAQNMGPSAFDYDKYYDDEESGIDSSTFYASQSGAYFSADSFPDSGANSPNFHYTTSNYDSVAAANSSFSPCSEEDSDFADYLGHSALNSASRSSPFPSILYYYDRSLDKENKKSLLLSFGILGLLSVILLCLGHSNTTTAQLIGLFRPLHPASMNTVINDFQRETLLWERIIGNLLSSALSALLSTLQRPGIVFLCSLLYLLFVAKKLLITENKGKKTESQAQFFVKTGAVALVGLAVSGLGLIGFWGLFWPSGSAQRIVQH